MKKIPIPSQQEIEQIYLVQNMTLSDSAKHFIVSVATFKQWLKFYNIKKAIDLVRDSMRKTCLQKYGVEFASQASSVKNKFRETCLKKYGTTSFLKTKSFREQSKKTNLLKRGVEYPTQSKEVLDKRVKNNLDKYGVEYPQQLEEVKQKAKSTCLNRYGVTTTLLEKETKEKIENTNLKKYGVKNPFEKGIIRDKIQKYFKYKYGSIHPTQNEQVQNKIKNTNLKRYGTPTFAESEINKDIREVLNNREKLKDLICSLYSKTFVSVAEKLGISDTTAAFYIRKHNLESLIDQHTSMPEQEIKGILKDISLRKDKSILGGQEIDLYSEEYKIGIEFNGNFWHCDKCLEKDYHKIKTDKAIKRGIFLFHIFEYEWDDARTKQAIIYRLKNLFNLNVNKVYARNCEIRQVSNKEASNFLNTNHIQGSASSQIRLGLYCDNELVSIMTFITYGLNKKYEYELNRFCCKNDYNVIGGASKLFKYFLKTYKPKSIISYSDIAKTTGKLYETLGFKLDHASKPQYHWVCGHNVLTRYQTQLKQLRKYGWVKEGEDKSESQVMRERGFNKIYDCGKKVWVFSN